MIKRTKLAKSGDKELILIMPEESRTIQGLMDISLLDNYFWNDNNGALHIPVQSNDNFQKILQSINLESPTEISKSVSVFYKNKTNLYELSREYIANTTETSMSTQGDVKIDTSFMNFEEVKGEEILNFEKEEILPFYLSKTSQGDVYKILNKAFEHSHEIIIWDYNPVADKIDLNELVGNNDNTNIEYKLITNDNDVTLALLIDDNTAYNIVFKDVANQESSIDLTNMFDIIINNGHYDK